MAKKVVRLTESDLMNIVEQCVYEYQQTLINESRLGNLARTAALGAGLAGGILGGMNGANAQSQYPNLNQDQIHTVDSLMNQKNKFRQTQDSIANQYGWKNRNINGQYIPVDSNGHYPEPGISLYSDDDSENIKKGTEQIKPFNDSVENINKQILQNIGDVNNCHYEVIIRINPNVGGREYNDRVSVNGHTYTVSYGKYTNHKGLPDDTVCVRKYNTLDEVLNNVPQLLVRLAKDEEYNNTNYQVFIQNTTLQLSEYRFQFLASLEKNHSKKEIIKDAQKELQRFNQHEHQRFEDLISNHKYKMFDKDEYGRLSSIKHTENGEVIYTDGQNEYIWDNNTMKYIERPKKARF